MRLIDADALKMEDFRHCLDCDSIIQVIKFAPTIEAELVKHGQWKHFYGNRGQCSVCGVVVSSTVRNNGSYCPNCGAKMKGGNT